MDVVTAADGLAPVLEPYAGRWKLGVRPGAWTAERREGTAVRFVADPSPRQLADELAEIEAGDAAQ